MQLKDMRSMGAHFNEPNNIYEGCQKSSWTHIIKALNGPDFDIH